ncbi:MAG: hypothetical protein LBI19_09760 [Oscillospiraceae bacterium]|jgi:hypothetical protein|nr:hypothetical protein [Oscillospiraceae bacterium]
MPKKHGAEFMMEFVEAYLDGEKNRLDWDLDFNHYLIEHYPKMEHDNSQMAGCFSYFLSEQGFDKGEGLSDTDHKELINRQYEKFKAAMHDFLC